MLPVVLSRADEVIEYTFRTTVIAGYEVTLWVLVVL